MKNIPMFTGDHGVASLILEEIPYTGTAYVHVQMTDDLEKLLEECVGFCRACGAKAIHGTGDEGLEKYNLFTAVLEMRGAARVDHEKLENLFPVTEVSVARWREVYNRSMEGIDNARVLTSLDEKQILQSGGAYFVHRDGELLGIGWLEDETLLAIAAVQPGMGERVFHTLMSMIEGAQIRLEVASTNSRAIRFYEKMGLVKTREIIRWYKIGSY